LTKDELQRLEEIVLPNISLERVRDTFLFSVYTGLRFSDAYELKPSDIQKEKDGKYWITIKKIIKTERPYRAIVLGKALNIVNKYKVESAITNKLLPLISNQKTNAYLKVIADFANIDKNLTHHCARHTFATIITLSNNVPIEVVSDMLGHSSLKSTQIYAKITDNLRRTTATALDEILK
jgi:integrase/recombinase XerD